MSESVGGKRIVVLADPGQSDSRVGSSDHETKWPAVGNFQLPFDYVGKKNPGRVCFWRDISFHNATPGNSFSADPEVLSIAEFPRSDQIYDDTGLLVVNWDAANGDPLYRGDTTLEYLRTRGRVPIRRLLYRGGTLLMESQTAQSRPVQESYDAILEKPELTVCTPKDHETASGYEASIVDWKPRHPIVEPFDQLRLSHDSPIKETEAIFVNVPDEIRAPKGSNGLRGADGNISKKLWFGWFTNWSVDWMPLLCVSDGKKGCYPVLLAKMEGRGMILASTMWLSVAQHDLSSRIAEVALTPDLMSRAAKAQRRVRRRRRIADAIVGALFLALTILVSGGIVYIARRANQSWILAAFGVGIIGVVTTLWKLFLHIRNRPLGVPPWKKSGIWKRRVRKGG